MDFYLPDYYIAGYYMFAYGYDTSYRPLHLSFTTYTMPYCRDSEGNYFTLFGATTTSFASYQNQGAWSCDAYKTGSSANKNLSLVSASYIQKLKTLSGLPIPELTQYNANGYYLKIPMTFYSSGVEGYTSPFFTLDWEHTESLQSSQLPSSESSYNSNYMNINVISNTYTIPSDDPSGGETGSDYSGIISAIYLIPASIIMIFFFKMIYQIFMNRKVRG